MKFTNKEIADAFRKAIPFLSKGDELIVYNVNTKFICHAICIGQHTSYSPRLDTLAYIAKNIIQIRMDQEICIEHWLYTRNLITTIYPSGDEMSEVQKYRLRWLNSLIEEFENA
jgi:alpha-D-ribose 1-methylphosphonate 5-triphosphate diphosphatase PhnM